MADIAMSVSCIIDGVNKVFLLENIEDIPITESSTISKHPIPTGEYVSDTMYKEPVTMEVTGTFSLAGKKGIVFTEGSQLSLEDIQSFFRKIKNEGILCDLVKVKVIDNNSPRFSIWKSMALQSIQWVEKINSLGFTFSFQQVMQVNISEYDVDLEDENLPDVEEPKTLNFTESLFKEEDIIKVITEVCNSWGIIGKDFLNELKSLGKSAAVGLVGGSITAIAVAVIIGSIVSGGAILLIGAIAAISFCLIKLISEIKKRAKRKVHEFKVYKSRKKTEEEMKRYIKMNDDILKEFQQLNKKMAVYQVSSDKAQQCILTIDDEYYCFTFTRNNNNNSYGLTILDLNGNIASNTKTISNVREGAKKSLDECNSDTSILSTENGYQVFLINPSENRTDKLTECFILVSAIDMGKFNEAVQKMVEAYLLYY